MEKIIKFLLTKEETHDTISKVSKTPAALAQLVERRLGKAEVGSSNLLGSFLETKGFPEFREALFQLHRPSTEEYALVPL